MNIKRLCVLFLILLVPGFLSSLEIKEGKIKLVLQEKNGRFSAYYLKDVKQNKYVPLLFDQDPRTTSLNILEGNKVYKMGEASGFQQTVEKTQEGARFVWKSAMLQVTEDFSFIRSQSSPLANGFSITVSVKNLSDQDIYIGIRYILDTYLGEDANIHFNTGTNKNITTEKSYSAFSLPAFVVSTDGTADGLGFMVMAKNGGVTQPDQLVIANWKRLNDSSWSFTANETRNFNLLPYSINDSALALYYNTARLGKGEQKQIKLAMGAYISEGFSVSSSASESPIASMFQNAIINEPKDGNDIESAVKSDLLTISDLIEKINSGLLNPGSISEGDLNIIRQIIDELKKRKTRYDGQ
ncbi:MAG: hypothetical protein E4H36_02650 [Spirochaetales bacterium]|nr:MAG: hypothetical protein E4H36_02650 [Spirochaetales bacterium]